MMYFACLILLLSSTAFADSQQIYAGAGGVIERGSDPETEPDGKKTHYLVSFQISDGGDDGVGLFTTTVVKENHDPVVQVLRVRRSGNDSFDILDNDTGNQIGWGYEVEFEHKDSLKVHGLVLNYRTENGDSVAHYLRFTRANDILFSTGSVVDSEGRMLMSWYEKMQQVHSSD